MKKLLYCLAFLSFAAQAQQDPVTIRLSTSGKTYAAGDAVQLDVYFAPSIPDNNKFTMWLFEANDTLARYDVAVSDLVATSTYRDVTNDQVDERVFNFTITLPTTIRTDINHNFAWWSKKDKGFAATIINTKAPTGLEDEYLASGEKVVAMYDLCGRKLDTPQAGTPFIAVLDNGRTRKIVMR